MPHRGKLFQALRRQVVRSGVGRIGLSLGLLDQRRDVEPLPGDARGNHPDSQSRHQQNSLIDTHCMAPRRKVPHCSPLPVKLQDHCARKGQIA